MRAAVYESAGADALEVREIPTPAPGPGEVRVKVAISAVNPTDWKLLRRADPAWEFAVPNQDGAGVIDAVGEGVDQARVGQRVWLLLAAANNRWGTAAEYCVLPAQRAVQLSDSASFELGASLGVPALTAAHCLLLDGGVAGQTVLVSGGAGAVGHAAIELARFMGAARVIATVSGPQKADLARAAGAHTVVNYRDADALEQICAAAPDGVDRVVEVALDANLDLDLSAAAPHAVLVSYAADDDSTAKLPIRRLMSQNITLRFMLLYAITAAELQAAIEATVAAVDAGALSTLPLHRFTLDQTAEALRAVEHGAVGKVLIDLALG
jgi:NADPH2:quinone reductase